DRAAGLLGQVERAEAPAAAEPEQGGGVGRAEAAIGAEGDTALRQAAEPRGERADDPVLERGAGVVDARPDRLVAVLRRGFQEITLDRVPVGEERAQPVACPEGAQAPREDRAAIVPRPELVAG